MNMRRIVAVLTLAVLPAMMIIAHGDIMGGPVANWGWFWGWEGGEAFAYAAAGVFFCAAFGPAGSIGCGLAGAG